MNSKLKDEMNDKLFEAILLLNNIEDCYNFFEDICTTTEIKAIAQRLEVAKLLEKGSKYNEISKETGASTATISRVNRFLNYGSGGYTSIIEQLKKKQEENE